MPYKATRRNRKYLRLYKQGKSIGFTMRSSLKAKGLIPRANGTYKVSDKYRSGNSIKNKNPRKTRRMKGGSREAALQVLELPNNASVGNIKKTFRRLALIHHPDKGGDDKYFKKIQGAYSYLTAANNNVKNVSWMNESQRQEQQQQQQQRNFGERKQENENIYRTYQRRQQNEQEQEKQNRQMMMTYNPERNSKFDQHNILQPTNDPIKSMEEYYNVTYTPGLVNELKTPVLFTGAKIHQILNGSGLYHSRMPLTQEMRQSRVNDMNFYRLYSSDINFKHFMDYNAQVEILLNQANSNKTVYGYEAIRDEQMAEHRRLVIESFINYMKNDPIFMYVYNNFDRYYDTFNYVNTFGIKNTLPENIIRVYDLKNEREYILYQEVEQENVNMATTEEENFSNL